jgi:hypothetical protein
VGAALGLPPLVVGVDDVNANATTVGERSDKSAKSFRCAACATDHAAEVLWVHAHLKDLAAWGTLCRHVHIFWVIDDPLDEVFESGSEHWLGLSRLCCCLGWRLGCCFFDDCFSRGGLYCRGLNYLVSGSLCRCLFSGCLDDSNRLLGLGLENRLLLLVSLENGLRLFDLDGALGVLVALEDAPVAGELEDCLNLRARLGANTEPARILPMRFKRIFTATISPEISMRFERRVVSVGAHSTRKL